MKMLSKDYSSPLGKIRLAADEIGLCGAWFEDQKYFGSLSEDLPYVSRIDKLQDPQEILLCSRTWFDEYFAGKNPSFTPPLHLCGSVFRQEIWELLVKIPYGVTVTYGEIAKQWEQEHPGRNVSFQAVGGAVGHNPVSVIVPCHRVVGSGGALTGYAGGLYRKKYLLELEKVKFKQDKVLSGRDQAKA